MEWNEIKEVEIYWNKVKKHRFYYYHMIDNGACFGDTAVSIVIWTWSARMEETSMNEIKSINTILDIDFDQTLWKA